MISKNNVSLEQRTDMTQSERQMWRTLVRVSDVNEKEVSLVFPSWNQSAPLTYNKGLFPSELRDNFQVGYRFHAPVNLGAEKSTDLYINIDFYESQ
jgi:hypothetical protein